MAHNRNNTQDADAGLDQLAIRAGVLRGRATLEASHTELQEAALLGQLVCWQPCRIHGENDNRMFAPGQALPKVDINHVVLTPDLRLVTTKARWQAVQEYKTLSAYVKGQPAIEAQLRQAVTTYEASAARVAELQQALIAERKALHRAEVERRQAESEVLSFVEGAPRSPMEGQRP